MSGTLDSSESRPDPRNKVELLERIESDRSTLEGLLEGASEERLTMPGPDGWSVKDHLAHITAWEQSILRLLQRQSRWPEGDPAVQDSDAPDIDRINQTIFARNQGRALADVLDDFRRTHQEVLAALDGLNDDDLKKPYAEFQPDEPPRHQTPVIRWITGNTDEHYRDHIPTVQALLSES